MRKKLLGCIILLAIFGCPKPSMSQQVAATLLQAKANRLYFADGTESGVFAGAKYAVICGDSIVAAGVIEYAGPGIAFTSPIAAIDQAGISVDCRFEITVATVIGDTTITLGTDLPLEIFDPEHETLFVRRGDTVSSRLVDSVTQVGQEMVLHLSPEIWFSDGRRLDAETVAWWLADLNFRSRSYLVRYFFAKLLPPEENGVAVLDAFTLRLRFRQALPRLAFLLSHPDFALYNQEYFGTGPLREIGSNNTGTPQKIFVPNIYYRGTAPQFSRIIINYYQRSHRMKFDFENGLLNGFFGFGYESDLAGQYQSRAFYPYIVAMISGLGRPAFSNGLLPTSLYYRYDSGRAHLFFPYGDIEEVERWTLINDSANPRSRYYPFDYDKGATLYRGIAGNVSHLNLVYDHPLLQEACRYLADLAAREGTTAECSRSSYGMPFDVRLALLPASDTLMPLALIAAVIELNDQNALLPDDRRRRQPGWVELGQGAVLSEPINRNRFFARAEEAVFEDGCFFPLFRPVVYCVGDRRTRGLTFDFYGYPLLDQVAMYNLPFGEER